MLHLTPQRPWTASAGVACVAAIVAAPAGYGAATSWAQAPTPPLTVSVERSFGPGWLQAIVALPGGGYAVAGRRGLPAKGDPKADLKASVIRLDEKGDTVWETIIEGKRLDLVGGLSLTPTGQLLLIGFAGNGADWAMTLDPSGKIQSEKSFGRSLAIFRRTVMLPNGGWASIGDDFDTGPPPKPTLFRFDASGVFLGKQVLPSPAGDDAPTPLVTPVGSSGLAVAWDAPAGAKARPRVVRFDTATWKSAWDITIDLDPELDPSVSTMVPLPGGGLAISGLIGAHGVPWWAVVVGADGRTQWLSRTGRFDFALPFASAGLADGGVVIGGCAITKEAKHSMPWLAILDAKGNLTSERVVPMRDGGAVLALAALPTGEFAATGISGNGCALIEAGVNGANTWVRVMRLGEIDRPR